MSPTAKNLSSATVGTVYALVYGLWTAIATGGGHVNFIWFWMFFKIELFGLYFPMMAVFAVNLRDRIARALFGSFIGANFLISLWMIFSWVTETPLDPPSDYARALRANGFGGLAFCALLHFLPTVVFSGILLAVSSRDSRENEESSIQTTYQN